MSGHEQAGHARTDRALPASVSSSSNSAERGDANDCGHMLARLQLAVTAAPPRKGFSYFSMCHFELRLHCQ